jgi:hypothetical protein
MTAQELYEALNRAGIHYEVVEEFEGSRHIQVAVEEQPVRDAMVEALVRKEIEWIVGDPTPENINDAVQFFTQGGFGVYSDEDIKEQFERMVTT